MTDFDCTPKVDLEFMNAEHRKAFEDADQIKSLLQSAKTDIGLVEKPLNSCLEQFLRDTVNHFQLEEKYMEEYQFPARKNHQQEHQLVLERMNDHCDYWRSKRNLDAIIRLEQFVSEEFPQWLVNHIVTMDTATASYIARHGGGSL